MTRPSGLKSGRPSAPGSAQICALGTPCRQQSTVPACACACGEPARVDLTERSLCGLHPRETPARLLSWWHKWWTANCMPGCKGEISHMGAGGGCLRCDRAFTCIIAHTQGLPRQIVGLACMFALNGAPSAK